jgi:8-oxo-dGDP phosphatase
MPHPYPDDPRPWQTLASEYLHRRPWLTLRQDRVRLPGGGEIESYFVSEFPPWANVVAVAADGRLVLVRQYRHALGQTHFELPGGTCDRYDEDVQEAARRELLEETGYGGGVWRPFMVLSANPALQTNLTHTFLATGVERLQEPKNDATEELAVHLLTPAEVRRVVLGGEVVQALHAAPLLKYLLTEVDGV